MDVWPYSNTFMFSSDKRNFVLKRYSTWSDAYHLQFPNYPTFFVDCVNYKSKESNTCPKTTRLHWKYFDVNFYPGGRTIFTENDQNNNKKRALVRSLTLLTKNERKANQRNRRISRRRWRRPLIFQERQGALSGEDALNLTIFRALSYSVATPKVLSPLEKFSAKSRWGRRIHARSGTVRVSSGIHVQNRILSKIRFEL